MKRYIKELKRIIKLSHQTFRIHGIRFLITEIVRYVIKGPLESDPNYKAPGDFYKFTYTSIEIDNTLQSFKFMPIVSIVGAIDTQNVGYIDRFVASVLQQHYGNWELLLCYNNDLSLQLFNDFKRYKTEDRIKWINTHDLNNHSEQLNIASMNAVGEYFAFPQLVDVLSRFALFENVKCVNSKNFPDIIYSDEDYFSIKGKYNNQHFKSDFNLPLLLSYNYISGFTLIKSGLVKSGKWFRKGFEGAEIYDFVLRNLIDTKQVVHIPKVLYHKNILKQKDGFVSVYDAEKKAIESYLKRNSIKAIVLNNAFKGSYRVKYDLTNRDKVSIIVPFKDNVALLQKCVNSVLDKTSYSNYEMLLISNNSQQTKTFEFLKNIQEKSEKVNVFIYDEPFNFSAINNWAVNKASGEYILLLNDDTEVLNDDWLEAMLEHIQQVNVGAVGAKLLYADNTIQHAGIVVGLSRLAGHPHRFLPDKKPGYFFRPHIVQRLTAVTGACLLTKRTVWFAVGGMDEKNLAVAYNDVDYCMKIREMGYDVIYTPYAKLYHHESKSRGADDTSEKRKRYVRECRYLMKKWGTDSFIDPFYNINLTQVLEDYSIR